MMLPMLPHEIIIHISTCLLARNRMDASKALALTCTEFSELLGPLHTPDTLKEHNLRWAITHLEADVVLRYRELHVSTADPGWRRGYGPLLNANKGHSTWEIRIDRSRANDGQMLLGVSLQHRDGTCEWCLCPKDGRLYRRSWDRDHHVVCGESPPPGYPAGHSKRMLVDAASGGEVVGLKGRAQGCIIEVSYDHDNGALAFRLNGGPQGAILVGFPKAESAASLSQDGKNETDNEHGARSQRLLLRPVIGLRFGAGLASELDDQVTIRSASRLQNGWPQACRHQNESVSTNAREEARGISVVAAKALRRALDASHASNRMRLASFRLSMK